MSTDLNSSQPGTSACPVCGAARSVATPDGLCPKCLLEGALVPTEPGDPGVATRPGVPELARLAEAFPELEIQGLLGVGGMGAVFRARQPHLDRWVALKVLPESLAAKPAFAERFNREARTLARLNHPNIVTVHDFGRRAGFYYLLMEFMDGVNLRQAMRAGGFTPEQALGLVPKICEALQFAHEEGVLHRDIKPENILLDGRGRVKIADFGIAKLLGEAESDPSLTVSGAALGTPAYMAPEQIENPSQVDHRADIYSLGVVFYEMLTGELPLGRFAPPSEKGTVDPRVDEIVMRALAKERELRQQSATQVRTEVEGVTQSAPARGKVEPTPSAVGDHGPGRAKPDFVLCHPWLPSMAQWITVYALVVMPVLWLLGLSTLEDVKDPSPYAQFLQFVMNLLLVVGELAVVVTLMLGGWKLRALQVSGPRLLRAGIWAHLVMGGVLVMLAIWLETVRRVPAAEDSTPGELLLAVAGLGAMVFEISALVWLRRHAHRLAVIFAEAAPSSADAAAEVAMTAPTVGVARHATLGAILTALSVVFGLAAIGGGALLGVSWYQNWLNQGAGFGLGWVEMALALLGLLVVVGGGVVGAILGWSALREVKGSGGTLGGVGRGMWAGLAWPLILAEMGMLVGLGWMFHRVGGGFWVMFLIARVGALAVAEGMVRSTWRWVRGTPSGQRVGRLSGSGRGLVVGSVLAAVVTLFPAYSVGWTHYLMSQVPEMVAVVRPADGGPGQGDLQVEYPPRSIVRLTATVYRDGVLQAEPRFDAHVLNGSVWESVEAAIRVEKAVDGEGHFWGGWQMKVMTEPHTVAYTASAELSRRVLWQPPASGPELRVAVNMMDEAIVLVGRDPEGPEWQVRLKVRVEPLPPNYLFEGAIAGQGEDWEKTAAYAVSLEESKSDE